MLTARDISFNGRYSQILAPTSFTAHPGEVTLLTGGTPESRSALALILTDRLRPSEGAVVVDPEESRSLRKRSAPVDAVDINEPAGDMTVLSLVSEDIALLPSGPLFGIRRAAHRWLEENGWEELARERIESIPSDLRTDLLSRLAAMDPRVEVIVLDSPDRHEHDADWLTPLSALASESPHGTPLTIVAAVDHAPPGFSGPSFDIGSTPDTEKDPS